MVDGRNYVEVLYRDTFVKMAYKRENVTPTKEAIYDFTNTTTPIVSHVDLKILISSEKEGVGQDNQSKVVETDSA